MTSQQLYSKLDAEQENNSKLSKKKKKEAWERSWRREKRGLESMQNLQNYQYSSKVPSQHDKGAYK